MLQTQRLPFAVQMSKQRFSYKVSGNSWGYQVIGGAGLGVISNTFLNYTDQPEELLSSRMKNFTFRLVLQEVWTGMKAKLDEY